MYSVSSLCVCDVVCVPPHLLFTLGQLAPNTYTHPRPTAEVCTCALVFCTCNPYLVCSNVWLSFLFHLSSLVNAIRTQLRQINLITFEEYWRFNDISDMVKVQRSKSSDVMFKTADVLRKYGFEEESRLLAGRQSRPSSLCLCYVVPMQKSMQLA